MKILKKVLVICMVSLIFFGGIVVSTGGQDSKLALAKSNQTQINSKTLEYPGLDFDVVIPVLSGMNEEIAAKYNRIFETSILIHVGRVLNLIDQVEADGIDAQHYVATTKYQVHSNREDLLSISLTYYEYTGGAHGMYYMDSYNIDRSTGENILLHELVGKENLPMINEYIYAEIDSRPEMFFPNAFESVAEDQNYYLDGEYLVIYFGLYEIAPYASGMPTFKIPLDLFY